MKQYTNADQTAKLMELGLPKPKNRLVKQRFDRSTSSWIVVGEEGDYNIGELIEMLPEVIEFGENDLLYPLHVTPTVGGGWAISYCNEYDERNKELIDALYDMIVKLKEEGVI